MCGRYQVRPDPKTLKKRLPQIDLTDLPDTPRYNLAPTQAGPVILQREEDNKPAVAVHRWGLLPPWAKEPGMASKMINARAETVHEKPAFRAAFRHRRCLVLAHGFYEWQETKKGKHPWMFSLPEGELMAFAGLWETWCPPEGKEPLHTYTIITTTATDSGGWLHDRMPLILQPEDWLTWLSLETEAKPELVVHLTGKLQAGETATDLRAFPVTPRMNTPRFESPECVKPVPPPAPDLETGTFL